MSTGVNQAVAQLEQRVGDPPVIHFPEGWSLSSSWSRAQRTVDLGGPVNAAERTVLLNDGGDPHRVLFAIYDGELVAECDCQGYRFNDWCAHLASCWWQWAGLGDLAVTDLATGRTYLSPPWWLDVRGGQP